MGKTMVTAEQGHDHFVVTSRHPGTDRTTGMAEFCHQITALGDGQDLDNSYHGHEQFVIK